MLEDRLRELLRDPGWSLPAWPDAEARVRRRARRQRIRAATAGAAVAGIVAAVVATVTGFQSPGVLGPHTPAIALPAPGAAGFPLSIYPPALPGLAGGRLTRCPDPDGLAAASPADRTRATAVVASLDAATFSTDLRLSDRAYWPQEQADRSAGAAAVRPGGRVLFSGPLTSSTAAAQAGALSRAVSISCGARAARDTWLVITSAPGRPGGQSEFLLLDRRGHLLVWNAV